MNINLDKQLLDAVLRIPDDQRKLKTVLSVMKRIEVNPKKNSRPVRNLLRKIIRHLAETENFKQEAGALKLRLRTLSRKHHKRKPKPVSPVSPEALTILESIEDDKPSASTAPTLQPTSGKYCSRCNRGRQCRPVNGQQICYECEPLTASTSASPIVLHNGESFRSCDRCHHVSWCRVVGDQGWICFDVCVPRGGEAAFLERFKTNPIEPPPVHTIPIQALPISEMSGYRYADLTPDQLAGIRRSRALAPNPNQTEQIRLANAEVARRRSEAEEHRRLAATPVEQLSFDERRKLVGL